MLYKVLKEAAAALENGVPPSVVRESAVAALVSCGVKVEYVSVADAYMQEISEKWSGGLAVLTTACRLFDEATSREVRLIDALHVNIVCDSSSARDEATA